MRGWKLAYLLSPRSFSLLTGARAREGTKRDLRVAFPLKVESGPSFASESAEATVPRSENERSVTVIWRRRTRVRPSHRHPENPRPERREWNGVAQSSYPSRIRAVS